MSMRFTKDSVNSFCGHVVPLRIVCDRDISQESIIWTSDSEAVGIHSFAQGSPYSFHDGVLLTLRQIGHAVITAELNGEVCRCEVTVRERRTADPEEPMQYYIGDLHDHMSMIHNRKDFAVREGETIEEYLHFVNDENRMDFSVISDHGDVVTEYEFLHGFTAVEELEPKNVVFFPGSESEATVIEQDRFGYSHKNSGEIVVINAAGYSGAMSWEEFYRDFADSPLPVATLAHPQVLGSDRNGMWNFCLHKNNGPELKRMVRLIEMGDGSDRGTQYIFEHVYSTALDNGFRVSTSCSSDSHGPVWGYNALPGKTVIMAPEKSEEMFLDALLANRAYASESGNIKLSYTVNGKTAPADLALTNRYTFHMECSFFREDSSTVPVKCQIISDRGEALYTAEGDAITSLDCTLTSDTARYFYLRLVDSEGRRTWSPPVWTGRAFDVYEEPQITPVDNSSFRILDEQTGSEAPELMNNNPDVTWTSGTETASILIDMQDARTVSAMGYYPPRLIDRELRDAGIIAADAISGFVCRYRISASEDGQEFVPCKEGMLRIFGGESILTFPPVNARFVRFEALSTAGKECDRKPYAHAHPIFAELTVFAPSDQ